VTSIARNSITRQGVEDMSDSMRRRVAKKRLGIRLVAGRNQKNLARGNKLESSVRRTKFFSEFGQSDQPAKFSSRHESNKGERDLVADGYYSPAK